jgi:protein SCO1/2
VTSRFAAMASVALLAAACDPASARSKSSSAPVENASVSAPSIDIELPDFQLVDQSGKAFRRSDMLGKVWVTDFIFTTCPSICPAMTRQMSGLVKELEGDAGVRFLSITVDPENDTPEKLAAFVKENGAPSAAWFQLTGDPKAVDDIVNKGFLMGVQRGPNKGDIAHAKRFVVVDKRAHVRGLFETDDAGLAALKRTVRELE